MSTTTTFGGMNLFYFSSKQDDNNRCLCHYSHKLIYNIFVYMCVLCTITAVVVARKCFPSCLFAKKHHQQRTRIAIEEKKERGSDEKKNNNKNKKSLRKTCRLHIAFHIVICIQTFTGLRCF